MPQVMTYRPITDNEGFARVAALEMFIWGVNERDAITVHVQRILTHTGGGIIGAYDGEELIGFTVGLATRDPEKLWSHMAGVHPRYQRQGIGYQLKLRQREWAQKEGYRRIHWTFDPLLSQNANFNLRLLRVQVRDYHVNFYGEMSGINAGLPTDRMEASWLLDDSAAPTPPQAIDFLPGTATDPQVDAPLEFSADWHALEIPYDFATLKNFDPALALAWRLAVRDRLQQAFAAGYSAVDFVRREGRCWYVLHRK